MAEQFDPIKHTLKAPGSKRLKLEYDEPPSNFAFKFNSRRYTRGSQDAAPDGGGRCGGGRGFTFQLVHFSAQPEPFLRQNAP